MYDKATGVIGGTGIDDARWLTDLESQEVATPYGAVKVTTGRVGSEPVVFLNRHGPGHQVPPHRVNYRANIWALRQLGVQRVLATAAVGSLNLDLVPGSLCLCDQFLDFTKARAATFFDGGPKGVVHTDMTSPYCVGIRQTLEETGRLLNLRVTSGGTYVATEGPRFESAAEIRAYRMLGGDVVGMTGVPEVVLAREAGLCYATLCLVTNFAAGLTGQPLTHQEVLDVMAAQSQSVRRILENAIPRLGQTSCPCRPGPD